MTTDVAGGMSPSPPKRFDMTFNFGHVLILLTVVSGLVGSYYVSGFRLDTLERKADRIDAKLDGFTATLIEAAVAKQRLQDIERRLDVAERR